MQWTLILSITNVICTAPLASAQYAVPMPMYAVAPAAMPVLLPAVALQPPRPTTTSTTTTTTTPRSVALAVPVPVQMPVPFAYAPAAVCQATPRPAHCPPCPPCLCLPSCTPAFFSYCSPCHQKCRCRSGADAPLPMPPVQPVPLQPPPPVIMVPFPPSIRLPRAKHKCRYSSSDTSTDDSRDSCSDDSLETSDSEYFYKRARKRKTSHRKRIHARRNNERPRHNEVVKPVLTYVSENGNVKFKTEISNAEAARLLEKRGSHEHSGQMESIQVTK
ncbi:unnamed protein product, partial [Iphiclides podalirius]